MKTKSLFSSLLLIVSLGAYTVLNTSYSGGFGSYSNTACVSCHGTSNPGTTMTIDNLPSVYTLGQTYPISVTVNNPSMIIAGFQLRTNVGTFGNLGSGVSLYSDNRSVGHSFPQAMSGGSAVFTLDWTAPTTGSTAANFAAQGLGANGNSSNSGDGGALVTVSNISLPVTFIDISATAKANSIAVNFETKDEENVRSFELERSIDGINFKTIETILSKGSSTYSVEDFSVDKARMYYYRINEISNDNKSTISNVVTAKLLKEKENISIYPSLVTNGKIFIAGLTDENATLSLYNLVGKRLQYIKNVSSEIELIPLHSGIYIALIETESGINAIQKIQIQ